MTFITYKNAVSTSSALWQLPHLGLWCFILMGWGGAAACCWRASSWPWAPLLPVPLPDPEHAGRWAHQHNPLLSWVVDHWPSTSRLQEKGRRSVKSVTTFQDLMRCWYPRFVAGYKSYLDLDWLRERRRSRYVVVWNKSWSVIFHQC